MSNAKQFKLTANENKILNYLKSEWDVYDQQYRWISPTWIGEACGNKAYVSASSWASPICLRLVKKGLIKRNKKGWYRYYVHKPIPDDCGDK